MWDSKPGRLRGMRTVKALSQQDDQNMLYIWAYYGSDQSSKLSIPDVVHFATNVDIASHNYKSMKLRKITCYNKEFM